MSQDAAERVRKQMMRDCSHQNRCLIDFHGIMVSRAKDVARFCNDDASFFIQVPCVAPAPQFKMVKVQGLFIACTVIVIILFSVNYIQYIQIKQDYKYIDFDFKTLSTSDYSVEIQISEQMWRNFLKDLYDESSSFSRIGQFRIYMKREFERRICSIPPIKSTENVDRSDY